MRPSASGRLSLFPENLTRNHGRFAGFIAVSIALHLLTLVGAGRFDLSAQRLGDAPAPRVELHATLAPARPSQPDAAFPAARSDADTTAKSAAQPAREEQAPRAGAAAEDAGLALPAADKWYVASEVDVRAEPLTAVRLHYPESLRGEPVVGKVHLRLFIDERGIIRRMQVSSSDPAGMFDETAKKDWGNVVFSPAIKNGMPVKSQKLLELIYQPGLI